MAALARGRNSDHINSQLQLLLITLDSYSGTLRSRRLQLLLLPGANTGVFCVDDERLLLLLLLRPECTHGAVGLLLAWTFPEVRDTPLLSNILP